MSNFTPEQRKELNELITKAVTEAIVQSVPAMIRATLASTRDNRLEADIIADAVEAQAEAVTNYERDVRVELGMSNGMATYKAMLSQGRDPTPENYAYPKHTKTIPSWDGKGVDSVEVAFSYFDGGSFAPAGFRSTFEAFLNEGKSVEDAYEATCAKFEVPHLRKSSKVAEAALKEIPETAGGAFKLGRGEAAAKAEGIGRLKAREEEAAVKELTSGGMFADSDLGDEDEEEGA